jgi:hypothetical protein
MHTEERGELINQLRRDTLFLKSIGVYGYALVCGVHFASPWDPWDMTLHESKRPSRFGGFDKCEDRYSLFRARVACDHKRPLQTLNKFESRIVWPVQV